MNRSSAKSEILDEVDFSQKLYNDNFSDNIYGSDTKITVQTAKKHIKIFFQKIFRKFFSIWSPIFKWLPFLALNDPQCLIRIFRCKNV